MEMAIHQAGKHLFFLYFFLFHSYSLSDDNSRWVIINSGTYTNDPERLLYSEKDKNRLPVKNLF